MFVKTHGRFDQFRRDICNFGQIPEKTRNGMPPPFSAFCKNETFDRLFCRLLGGEKLVGDLNPHARAVAGGSIAADGPAVLEIDQHVHRLLDHRVQRLGVEANDESDAATVVLEGGIVETSRS